MMETFEKYDRDVSGSLNLSEITTMLGDLRLTPKTKREQEEIKRILEDVDEDGSGEIDFSEFTALVLRVQERLRFVQRRQETEMAQELGFSDEQLSQFRNAFYTLDQDNSEALDVVELRQAFVLLRKPVSSDTLLSLFNALDKDGSGSLEFEEFLLLMKMMEERKGIFEVEPPKVTCIEDLDDLQMQTILDALPSKPSRLYLQTLSHEQLIETVSDFLRVHRTKDLKKEFGVEYFEDLVAKAKEVARTEEEEAW